MKRLVRTATTPVGKGVAQAICVALLVLAAVLFGQRISGLEQAREEDQQTTTAVTAILAESCGAASFKELRQQGLVEECRLAQQGKLGDAIPEDELPPAGADVTEVDPDVVADDGTSTPSDLRETPVGSIVVRSAVADYFDENPLGTQPGYQRAISRTVSSFLTEDPPKPGRPPTRAEIRGAVRTALLANPPADGVDGADGNNGSDGRGVASASLDGCDVVFIYSDGSVDRVGPLCGPQGPAGPGPTDTELANAVASYCNANGECRGQQGPTGVVQTADNCQPVEGEYVTDVALNYSADQRIITVSCTTTSTLLTNNGNGSG